MSKNNSLYDILIGPLCVMVPDPRLAYGYGVLKQHVQNLIYQKGEYWTSILIQLPCGVHSRMAILLNLEIIFIITTAPATCYDFDWRHEICSRDFDFVSSCIFCKYFAKIYIFNHSFGSSKMYVTDLNIGTLCKCFFIYGKNRQILIHVYNSRAGQ